MNATAVSILNDRMELFYSVKSGQTSFDQSSSKDSIERKNHKVINLITLGVCPSLKFNSFLNYNPFENEC